MEVLALAGSKLGAAESPQSAPSSSMLHGASCNYEARGVEVGTKSLHTVFCVQYHNNSHGS